MMETLENETFVDNVHDEYEDHNDDIYKDVDDDEYLFSTTMPSVTSKSSSSSSPENWKQTFDSPYYSSRIEKYMKEHTNQVNTSLDMMEKSKHLKQCGHRMVESTYELASMCQVLLQNFPTSQKEGKDNDVDSNSDTTNKCDDTSHENGQEDLILVISTLKDLLDELAPIQSQLVEILEASWSCLDSSLYSSDKNAINHDKETKKQKRQQKHEESQQILESLQRNVEESSLQAENTWTSFLSRSVSTSVSTPSSSSSSSSSFWQKGGGLKRLASFQLRHARTKANISTESMVTDTAISRPNISTDDANNDISNPDLMNLPTLQNIPDPSAVALTYNRLIVEQARYDQTAAELHRHQFMETLLRLKHQHNVQTGESALASLHGISTYLYRCANLLQDLSPKLPILRNRLQKRWHLDELSLVPWQDRQIRLTQMLKQLSQSIEHASEIHDMVINGEMVLPTNVSDLEFLVDKHMTKLWELPYILAESTQHHFHSDPTVILEGWLYMKSAHRFSFQPLWTKCWFRMNGDGIYYFSTRSDGKMSSSKSDWVFLCDTVLCTVRESSPMFSSTFHQAPALQNGGMSYTFELLSPNHKKPIVLQARSPIEYKLWVDTIRRSMEAKLEASKLQSVYAGAQRPEGQLQQQFQNDETISRHGSSMISTNNFNLHHIPTTTTSLTGSSQAESCILRILQSNPYCSECRTVNPEWVSLNLCVVFCKECSGIHRSLGVHCSKVRSLKLDSLTPSECQLILALGGNDKVNSEIWEAGLSLGINDAINNIYDYTKPTPSSSWEEKNRWIQAKYKGKEFLGMPEAAIVSSSPPTLCSLESGDDSKDENSNKDNQIMEYSVNLALYTASQQGNLMDIAKALVHGADVHWKNPSNDGETPLHICMRGNPTHRGNDTFRPECAELLLQYGAKLDAIDDKTQTVWDVCSHMAIEFLESRKRKS